MRVFLTGARGMLGRHVFAKLTSLGHEVLAPSRIELDLKDSEATLKAMRAFEPHSVIHCAAVVGGIKANILGGGKFLTENLEIDHSVIFSAKKLSTPNFIYLGSSCMYPANRLEPLKIDDLFSGKLEPTNASYALAKISGAKAIEAFDIDPTLNWKVFIASNLYGPFDHFDLERSHLLAAIIRKVSEALEVRSNEIEMWGDGNVKREFTFVTDLAEWIVESLPNLSKFPSLINVGSGEDYTVREFYEIVASTLGFEGDIVADPSKPNGNLRKLMDSSVAKSLGWDPTTNLREGVMATHKWWVESRANIES
jgi:GDP-L-fucose synthase